MAEHPDDLELPKSDFETLGREFSRRASSENRPDSQVRAGDYQGLTRKEQLAPAAGYEARVDRRRKTKLKIDSAGN